MGKRYQLIRTLKIRWVENPAKDHPRPLVCRLSGTHNELAAILSPSVDIKYSSLIL